MLTRLGVPALVWLHERVCQFDHYLYTCLETLGVYEAPDLDDE